MKRKIKFLTIFLFCLICTLKVFAQVEGGPLTKKTPVRVPESYKQPIGKIEPENAAQIKSASNPYYANFWLVYSDRDNNQTFKDRNLTQPMSKVNFKEVFYVADQNDKAVRLVVYDPAAPGVDEEKGKAFFLPVAQDAGWISKKNLLLWSVCLVDTINTYARKAVAIKRLSSEADFVQTIKRGVLDFYDAPEKIKENDKDVKLFQYLFIYKEENGMYLLGNINVLKANTIGYDLYGWVSKTNVQEWTSAICLRVNFDEQAKEDREKKKLEPQFFRTEGQATNYYDGLKADPMPFNYFDPSENDKDNPFLLGYPIISTTKHPSVFKTGYVTNTVNKKGVNIFSAIATADLTKNWEEIKNQKEKVNIIFVLDGAERSYFKTLVQAIDANQSIGNANATNNKYSLGAIIYNDLQCGEDDAFIKLRFKTSKDNFILSLQEEAEKKPSCAITRSAGAPLNDALKIACDFFESNKTTNVVIVIGSVTDNDNLKKEAALKELINKKVKMFFYQTAMKNTKYYDDYVRNSKYFLTQMSDAADVHFKAAIENQIRKKAALICEGEKCKLINSSIPGECYFKDEGKQFSSQEMNSNLKRLLLMLEENLNQDKAMFDQNIVGAGKDVNVIESEDRTKEFQSWLYDAKIPDAVIQKLSTMDNYQLFIEGYTALKPKDAIYPIFERNLFVADREFQQLYAMIEKVTDALTASNKRDAVVEACSEIIFTYRGPVNEKQRDAYSIDAIYDMITKLKGATVNPLFKKSLKDIKDEKRTPSTEIDKLYDSFKQVQERLKILRKNPLNRYEQDDQLFYWVPESKLAID